MKDVLVQDLFNCIREEVSRNKNSASGNEIRVFTASFPPETIHDVLSQVADYCLTMPDMEFVAKVSNGLYERWKADGSSLFLTKLLDREWIDTEDRLTAFRNQKCSPPYKRLLTVLCGIEYATDTSGLSDFLVIDEEVLWHRTMGQSYREWLGKTFVACDFDPGDPLLDDCNAFFEDIYSRFPRDLANLSQFLVGISNKAGSFSSAKDLLQYLYTQLPNWGVPPISQSPRKQWRKHFAAAVKFIHYSDYIDRTRRNAALKKIDSMLKGIEENTKTFAEPDPLPGENFIEATTYLETARTFVAQNDLASKDTLLKYNIAPLLELLVRREKKPPRDAMPIVTYTGPSYECILRAIVNSVWHARRDQESLSRDILRITVTIESFIHDFVEDGETSSLSAADVLKGLLGGLNDYLNIEIINSADELGSEQNSFDIELGMDFDEITTPSRANVTPYVEFSVGIQTASSDTEGGITRPYRWQCPETHEERVALNLATEAINSLRNSLGTYLPAYNMSTFDELFFSSSAEESNRLTALGLDQFFVVKNILSDALLQKIEPIKSEVSRLQRVYTEYLETHVNEGLYAALRSKGAPLIDAYSAVVERILDRRDFFESDFAYAFSKAFLIVPKDTQFSRRYLPSAVATALSPAVIEILQARQIYLTSAFPFVIQRLLADAKPSPSTFEHLASMLEIKRPVLALIRDENRSLTSKCISFGLIHCIGEAPTLRLPLASQAVLEEETVDQELSNTQLFQTGAEADIYAELLLNYYSTHEVAEDGLTVWALDVKDLQSIVAGVDRFLTRILATRSLDAPPYQFALKIVTRGTSSLSAHKWLTAWRLRWDAQRGQSKYQNCDVSISYKSVRKIDEYMKLLENERDTADIAMLVRFMHSTTGGDDFEDAPQFKFDPLVYLKFPMTEYPRPVTDAEADKYRRHTVIANRRMRVPTLHADLCSKIKTPDNTSRYHVLTAPVDYEPWMRLIDALHGHANWVACVDPYVDKKLASSKLIEPSSGHRDIVGFATGLGSYGELNLTVSTQFTTLSSVHTDLSNKLRLVIPSLDSARAKSAAQRLLGQTANISGMSLVKATSNERELRDFIAYSLFARNVEEKAGTVCDIVLPLDSYRHWLQANEDEDVEPGLGRYPDLLQLRVSLASHNRLYVEAAVIECKLAQRNEIHLNKGVEQARRGTECLAESFLPRGLGASNKQYDRRYWWAQLQRVIATHSSITASQKKDMVAALENMSEGLYTIAWRAMVLTLWTDDPAQATVVERISHASVKLTPDQNEIVIPIFAVACGQAQIEELCFSDQHKLNWPAEPIFIEPLQAELPSDDDLGSAKSSIVPSFIESMNSTVAASSSVADPSQRDSESQHITKGAETTLVGAMTNPQHPTSSTGTVPSTNSGSEIHGSEFTPLTEKDDESIDSAQSAEPVTKAVVAEPRANIVDRVLLGAANNKSIHWEFGHSELQNRHLLIFGKSGSGKTYAIQCVLAELARKGQNSLIVDYTDGFLTRRLEPKFRSATNPLTYVIRNRPLPINPFRFQSAIIEDLDDEVVQDKPSDVAARVVDVINSAYNLGSQQVNALTQAIKTGLEQDADKLTFAKVVEILGTSDFDGADTLAMKLTPFAEGSYFGSEDQSQSWSAFFNDRTNLVHILQLTQIPKLAARIITEMILWDLFYFARTEGDENTPRTIVLDEVQNLDHSLESPLGKILTEGRKFGLSLILATQSLRAVDAAARDRLFQASHKLFFLPAETEMKDYAKLLADNTSSSAEEWKDRLRSLKKGECWSIGPSADGTGLKERPYKIRITSFDERDLSTFAPLEENDEND